MPLECPQLVIDWYAGGYNEFALNGMAIWSQALDRRNVDLFRRFWTEMQEKMNKMNIDHLNTFRTISCLKYCEHKDYAESLKTFEKFSNDIESNIF